MRSDIAATGTALLERERELATLAALIEGAQAGSARVVVVEGRAGMGKTQLIGEARRQAAEAGLRTLSARGGELEREFAFGVVRQLFEPLLVRAEARESLLAGAAAAAGPVFDSLPSPEGEVGDTSFAVLHGLFWLTLNLSTESPLLLAIDDLHWCDRPSLRFLAYLTRRLEGLPVLMVCSLRPSEPGADAVLLSDIAGDPLATSLHPGPLSEPAVADLVRRRLGEHADDAFAAACHIATGGNPLLLNELLKALETEGVRPDASQIAVVADLGPRAASRAVLLRLARLSPEAVAAARALAILGDGADLTSVAGLAGLAEREAAAATATLSRAEIIRSDMPLGFVHPLVAGAVYRDIPPGERELQHERAAHLLARSGASVEHVAAHLLAMPAHGERWIVDTLREAASAAMQKGAPDSAASYLARALLEPPEEDKRAQVLFELGLAEVLTNAPAAAEHLRLAYDGLSDPRVRGEAAGVLGRALLFSGSPVEAAAIARHAAGELPRELSELRAALEAFELLAAFFDIDESNARERMRRYRTARPSEGIEAKLLGAIASMEWTYSDGTAEECLELATGALEGGDLIRATGDGLSAFPAIVVLIAADRPEVMDVWDLAMAEAHRRGSLFLVSSIHLWRGYTLLRRGELTEAETELQTAAHEFDLYGYGPTAHAYLGGILGPTLVERGDLAGARAAIAAAGGPELGPDGTRYWLNGRLELLVSEGRYQEALEVAETLTRVYSWVVNPAMDARRSLIARALDGLGRHDEALAVAKEELECARRWGAPGALGRSLRVLGTIEREEGLRHLEEAVRVLDGSTARLELAKALAALGSTLRRSRKPADAREPLRRALELAEVCGAPPLAEHARSELYAAGARPRTTALQGVDALTASERRVAGLAAEGQTNRDIAQTLFVTPKTVEVHLSNVYRKLGIRSRRELAPALGTG